MPGMADLQLPRRDDGEAGVEYWRDADLVAAYDRADLRAVEADLLERYREVLSGKVLEIGVGAGRVTRHLCPIAAELHGIDVSRAMVRRASKACPDATIVVRDLREVGVYGHSVFDAIVASFNVVDVLDHEAREKLFDALARILVPGGLLLFSSHNLGAIGTVHGPVGQIVDDLEHLRLKRTVAGVFRLPRRVANHARMRAMERNGQTYAIVNDSAHDYALAQYYIERDEQERQLARHGFRLDGCWELSGAPVFAAMRAEHASELYYAATLIEPVSAPASDGQPRRSDR
jgi:SAM-dependent methyltransferase